tara:strand:+ start:298 stop:552 length:255 start_codon:yes stop_codon:yes gene_type:complete
MTESNRQKLTGLFINETKDGVQYLSGKTQDGKKYTAFQNTYKETENQPDWILYFEDTNLQRPVSQAKTLNLRPTPKTTPEDMPF